MKCIIGLGNIGKEYENTRHNTGIMCLNRFMEKNNVKMDKKMKKSIYGEMKYGQEKVLCVFPTTYMNLSGEAIQEIISYFKIDIKDILVIVDDIDLELGKYRYKENSSAGTHNGLRNIISVLKTEEFARLKIGIENRQNKNIPLIDYVLQKFNKDELEVLEKVFNESNKIIEEFLTK